MKMTMGIGMEVRTSGRKMKLVSEQEAKEVKKRLKPVDHFKKCPCCGGKELHPVGPDLICIDCCWDSTAWDVNQGGMDNVFTAAREYGFSTLNSVPVDRTELDPLIDVQITETQGA